MVKRSNSNSLERSRKLTPLARQILSLHKSHPIGLLLVESGYTYHFYGPDALLVSNLLNTNFTDGWKHFEVLNDQNEEDKQWNKFAKVTINESFVESTIETLVSHGLRINVASISTSSLNSNSSSEGSIMQRKVVDVYTPGTFMGFTFKNENINENSFGGSILYVDNSGIISINLWQENIIWDDNMENLNTKLIHFEPNEILINENLNLKFKKSIEKFKSNYKMDNFNNKIKKDIPIININQNFNFNELINFFIDLSLPDKVISFLNHLNSDILHCFYQIFKYLKSLGLNCSQLLKLNKIKKFTEFNDTMILSGSVLKELEVFENNTDHSIDGSLLSILNNCITKSGEKKLKFWLSRPSTNRSIINKRQEAVYSLKEKLNSIQVTQLKSILELFKGIQLLYVKIKHKKVKPFEFYQFLTKVEKINKFDYPIHLYSLDSLKSSYLYQLFESLKNFKKLLNSISLIKDQINPIVAMDKNISNFWLYFKNNHSSFHLLEPLLNQLNDLNNQFELELINIRLITKKSYLNYSKLRNLNYLITLRRSEVGTPPENWIQIFSTKNTRVFQTLNIVNLVKRQNELFVELKIISNKLFTELLNSINQMENLFNLFDTLNTLDVLLSFAVTANNNCYNYPNLIDSATIDLTNCFHPINSKNNAKFTSNNIILQKNACDGRIMLLSGPNMGGKSTLMRMIGLLIIMCQSGSLIPANGTMGVFKGIGVRMGEKDLGSSLWEELKDMVNLLKIVDSNCWEETNNFIDKDNNNNNNNNSISYDSDFTCDDSLDDNYILLIDELGKSTSTVDAMSIATATVTHLSKLENLLCVFITHLPLQSIENETNGIVKNYKMGWENGFTYKLQRGWGDSMGLQCAQMAGLDDVVDIAQNVIDDYEWYNSVTDIIYNDKKMDIYKLWKLCQKLA
ncbi:hypothetical protein DAMA08_016300 [Martiniozyma asiatica (nom. inval.)]|nr:hypothetical protein DAMA08_016300 [Martiniozyma asiatica]